jgi:hypothetical protein
MTQKMTTTEWDAISGAAMIIGAVLLIAAAFLISGCGSTWAGMKADVHRWTSPPPTPEERIGVLSGERVPRQDKEIKNIHATW